MKQSTHIVDAKKSNLFVHISSISINNITELQANPAVITRRAQWNTRRADLKHMFRSSMSEVRLQDNSLLLASCFTLVQKEETGCSENHEISELQEFSMLWHLVKWWIVTVISYLTLQLRLSPKVKAGHNLRWGNTSIWGTFPLFYMSLWPGIVPLHLWAVLSCFSSISIRTSI